MLLQVRVVSTFTDEQTESYKVIRALGRPASLRVKVVKSQHPLPAIPHFPAVITVSFEGRTRVSHSQALYHPRIILYSLGLVSKAVNGLVAYMSPICVKCLL